MIGTVHLLLLLLAAGLHVEHCSCQVVLGEYPSPISVATFRPVTASAVCGDANGAEDYCRYTADATESLENCISTICNNTCPFSSSSPPPIPITTLGGTLGPGVTTTNGRPGTTTAAWRFVNSSVNTSEALVPLLGGRGFSFAAWINQDEGNTGTLISKATVDGLERNYVLTVNQSSITFDYLPSTLDTSSLPPEAQRYASVFINGLSLHSAFWHHIAVTVYAEDAAFYVNGTVVTVQALEGEMVDEMRAVFLGQTIDSVGYYNGLMQEVYLYTQALTAREVTELVTGSLPFAHLSPECHCPPSHPVINPDSGGDCIQNSGGNLVSRGSVRRINSLAHPPGFINDFGTFNGWISAPGDREVNITLHLTNSLYELIFVNFRYGSPRPKAVVLETSKDGGVTFQPVQYYADDCMLYFGLPNDGQIVNADDANCITTTSFPTPTFNADVRTRLLDPQTRNFMLNTSPELRMFLLGSHLRLRLIDFFNESVTPLHLYYSILEVTIAARCACNGHSSRCGPDIDSVCQCVHNTEGDNCERCAPLYNNKPWRYGITSNGFPCKLCDCNGHASSCHYNSSIDPFPDSYDIGGGGMCDNCQDDTAGQRCETCRYGFYRPPGRQPDDTSPCAACSCDSRGIVDEGDCIKSEGIGGAIAGQCYCKTNVIGQTCDTCRESFFGLSSDNPNGCEPCGCNTAGTFDASVTCDSQTGQCQCRGNVEGLKCDQCRNGTTGLNTLNPLGCSECTCNLTGSVSNNCDPLSGSCVCKPGVGGPLCDRCLQGYFGFSDTGCQPCTCHSEGAVSNICSSATGECTCTDNVVGSRCDSCASGFYNISASCTPCACNTAGTLDGNDTCDMVSGQCDCKLNVVGRTCDTCSTGSTNLTAPNHDGCSPCVCFMPNTITSGIVCHPVTSQCECVPSATGLQCDSCQDGFYFTPRGCTPCDCSVQGSASSVCDTMTGQCTCVGDGVGGRVCDRCLPGFFQFPNCTSCGCDPAGAIETTQCNPQTGACQCKLYVTGATCNSCTLGFQMLDASNPFGCSAAPDEQAPPTAMPQDSSSILLQWSPPEASNGVILGYNVYRNGSFIANTSSLNYTDTGLMPDSTYSYFIEAFNVIGSTTSATILTRTLEGIPSGIAPLTLLPVNSSTVLASWQAPVVTNGIISRYELVLTSVEDQAMEEVVFTGLSLSSTVSGLRPFTVYTFEVRACTSGGCGSSGDSPVQTEQAPPTFQPAPNVTTLSPMTVEVSWYPPPEPNGIVERYEIFQRNSSLGGGFSVGSVPNGTLSLVVEGLRPFTQYEFQVVSYTAGGGTQSEWSLGSTASSVPEGVLPPTLTSLSPFEIQVNWTEPLTPNGIIIRYVVYMISIDMVTLPSRFLLLSSNEPGSLVTEQLQPFTQYGFQLEACTSVGCSDSNNVTSFTLESAPIGQGPPRVVNITATSVDLEWDTPALPNGIITNYVVQRRRPSLSPSPAIRDIGIAFNGNGFATFPPDSVSIGGFRNEISLRFRTFGTGGTIVYYINAAGTDYLAIELRLGVPWFFFDAGTGPAAIRPDTDVVFNDGLWHEVTVRQEGQTGTITIDRLHTGTGNSTGSDKVISANQTLYVGAIPPSVPHTTIFGGLNPNATLDGINFIGCLFGVTVNGQLLDFSAQANTNPGVGVGCPVSVERGASLLGAGYVVLQENTITASSFVINYDLRATHTRGFIFFAHTRDNASLAIELRNSSIYLVTSSAAGSRDEVSVGSNPFCDGQWHSLSIEQQENQVFLSVDGTRQSLTLPQLNSVFSSRLYIGGAPQNSVAFAIASRSGLDVNTPFSGCIRSTAPNYFVNGTAIIPVTEEAQSVTFDGCHNSTESLCVPPWVSRDVAQVTAATDEGLNPFTDYLYRISAENSAGRGVSPWVVTMTEESAPSGVGAPQLLSRTSSSLTLTWRRPTVPNGLIIRYDVAAIPVSTIGLVSPLGIITMVTVEVREPEMVLMATLTGLEPATTHSVYLTAYTAAGGGNGSAIAFVTLESAPVGVQAPFVVTTDSRQLDLAWNTPTQPNGVIVGYDLFVNDRLQLSTPNTSATVDNLDPFTEYSFFLRACTAVGCGNSSMSVGQTLPDRPMGLAAPNLTALSPSSIQVTWELPADPNGIILRFELRILVPNLSLNFSGMDFQTTIPGLAPNTLYMFQLLAYNAGGFTTSPTAEVRTLEDIPDGITAPDIEVVNSTALRATWREPLRPNGVIIHYVLTQNGTAVFRGVALSYLATDLQPFSFYSYSIMACTVRGCGSSNQSSARTAEDIPDGYIDPTILMATASSITVVINPVTNPNGVVRYILYVLGEFATVGAGLSDTITETRVVYDSFETESVEIEDLLPFSPYEFTLSIVNSAGNLTGEPFTVETEAAAPVGLSAPMLTLQDNATTLRIQWAPPTQLNGPLRYYQVNLTNSSHILIFNASLDNFLVVGDLRPFTYYDVFVTVFNSVGSADSPTSNITTGETAPSGFDQVVVLERGPRYLLLSWDPPAAANGLLVNYTVLQDGTTLVSVPPSVMQYNVSSLLPFMMYGFSVVVCTSAGCVESLSVNATTLEDVPEGVPPPILLDGVASTVLISWDTPSSPNGVILEYQVEKNEGGDNNFTAIATVAGNAFRVFVDTNILPFTTYEYRIVVVNGAGSTTGPSANFTTPEAAPSDVLPPILTALSSSSINVRFLLPLTPNGIITSNTLTRSTPLTPTATTISLNTSSLPMTDGYFVYIDMNLLPFTNYTYILTICTNGGCTDSSSPVQETTREDTPQGISVPTAVVQNSTTISVSWVSPTQPNGVIQSYDLLRRDLGFSDSTAGMMVTNCCEEYLSSQTGSGIITLSEGCNYVVQTPSDITTYTDDTLQAYSFYQYCIIASNNADSAHSELSQPNQTDPAPMPAVGPQLNASTVNSTSVYLSWSTLDVSQLLGPLAGYTLYGKVAGAEGLGEVLLTSLDQSYTATGLIASTEYAFVVAVSNGRGATLGNTATAITEEGVPANLSAPVVDALDSNSLSIAWSEPQQPNGVIIIYTVFLDSLVLHNQSDPGVLIVNGLTPFTIYTILVEACTQFGCTRSPLVSERTLEGAPVGLASPIVRVTGPTSANVSWSAPVQPNGIITNYQLFQRDPSGNTMLIFSDLAFQFIVTNLRPFTTYGFEVIASNSAGNVSSGFTMETTQETAPSFVAPPIPTVLSANEILLSWSQPAELNGDLLGYQIYLDGTLLLTTLLTSYTHTGLEPFTEYAYVLEACTNGGCTNSTTASNTTFEALPEVVSDLVISQLQARSLSLTWQSPAMPNGIVSEFILTLTNNNTVLFRGLAFSLSVTDLIPFTSYSFLLQTCNSIGCVSSNIVEARTPETNPEGLQAPRLRNLTSTSVAIEWSAPSFPNGNITNYILRRGNESSDGMTVVFQGLAFSYNDIGLVADTLYSYTVEAVNSGGSLESPRSFIQTIPDLPEGIQPPNLNVLGPTSIRVSWSPPQRPNGMISRYILYMNNIPVFTTGNGFQYVALGLTPFTLYSFYYEVCNQAGCASSITVSNLTAQSLPQGVTPPTLNVLGATAIEVSWQPPAMPNGIITMYEIRRRLFNDPLTESIQHRNGPSVLSFPNSGLNPFTTYEYRLRVFNGAGNVFSEWVAERTLEDIPEGVSLPSFADSDIFARNVTATWDPPTSPNGIIVSYRLEYRLPLDPLTNLPGIPVTAADVPGNVTTATAVGLLPVMIYEFRVVAINGAGEGEGNFETVTTGEDVPEGLQPIIVGERTGVSLTLTWSPPQTQNGAIREYLLYVDGDLVYRDSPRTYTVLRLQPFTNYTLQLAACTSAGCTFGSIQSETTAETAPFGQPTPTLTARSPRIVEVVWNSPAQPNGIITRYEILRQDNGFPSTLVVISSTIDTLSRRYLDTTVSPASDYQYAIRAINSAGRTEGEFRPIMTPEAPPEGLTAPVLTVTSSSSILVSWNPPTQSNGIITEYQAFRSSGGMTNVSVYRQQNRVFSDNGLQPFTLYTYTIQACTSGGCSLSPNSSETTLQARPADFAAPTLEAVSATEISVQWDQPRMPNGIITHYLVTILPVSITVRTTQLAVNITNLLPFTLYTINVDVCNSIGCLTSTGQVRTLESLPQFINAPQLNVIDPFTIQVSWQEPARPNGDIIRYDLRRNNTVIATFNGSVLSFIDTNLMPDSFYSYTIQAFTSVGSGDISASSVIPTPPDTPEDISPPILEVLGANSIRARWSVPGTPNGIIRSYMLEVNGSVAFTGLAFEYVLDNLSPFTVYSFGLVVCTSTCGRSQVVTEMTDEAPPAGQAPPQLVANPNTTVTVAWNEPAVLNGVIRYYEVERRQVLEGGVRGRFAVVYNNSVTQFLDTGSQLQPAMMYEYRVTAVNGGGRNTSEVSLVTLLDAPPIGVYPPVVENITSVSLSVLIVPPLVPNGMLTEYRLYQDGIQIRSTVPGSQTSTVVFRVTSLQPFTVYMFHAEVCTARGCNSSQAVSPHTGEAQPTGLDMAPMAVVLSSRSINVSWVPPSQPNGEIVRYTLWFRLACPQPEQPNQPVCTTPGPRTLATSNLPGTATLHLFTGSGSDDPVPYTAYQFQIEAANSVGSVTSPYSTSVTTDASTPEPIQAGLQFSSDQENRLISLNWSGAFNLNSRLIHYIVSRNSISVQQLQGTQVTLTLEPVGIPLEYVVTAVTETGRVSLDPIVLQLGDTQVTGPSESPTVTTPSVVLPTEATPFYREAAFIVGMVVVGVILLFTCCTVFLCCVRPRGNTGYKVNDPYVPLTTPLNTPTKSGFKHVQPRQEHATDTWTPGDPSWEIPDLDEEHVDPVMVPSARSYSPKKAEAAALLDHEVLEPTLPDTQIKGYTNPQQFIPAREDFGSFRASQTTFADTKV